MQSSEYKTMFENESSHFYYLGNHRIILSLVNKYFSKRKNLKILDAGCGTGMLASRLKPLGDVVGIDSSPIAVQFAKVRKINVKKATVAKIPFKNDNFDLVVSIDVIYHNSIKNDLVPLREFYRVLKPGGLLIIRVPANKWLLRSTDQHVHTRERYTLKELEDKLIVTGFKICKITYINISLLIPAITAYFFEKIFSPRETHSPATRLPYIINLILTKVVSFESIFATSHVNLPFGLGVLAVCKKP